MLFQSTLPRRERLPGGSWDLGADVFQSTLPRRERLKQQAQGIEQMLFQSTLPRRERRSAGKRTQRRLSYFNPRSREGSDRLYLWIQHRRAISIHAPAKGATIMEMPCLRLHRHFNPRSREGSDPVPSLSRLDYPFQSTLPRRERPLESSTARSSFDFNPRSREGSDLML